MKDIIHYLSAHGLPTERLILIPPPPTNMPPGNLVKTNEMTRKYYDACRELAKTVGAKTLDFWDDLNAPIMFTDQVHFSKQGSEIVFK